MKTDIGTDKDAEDRIADDAPAAAGDGTDASSATGSNTAETGNAPAPSQNTDTGTDTSAEASAETPSAGTDAGTGTAAAAAAGADGTLTAIDSEALERARKRLFSIQKVNGQKRLMIFGVEFVYLYILGICAAFLGWVAENVVHIIIVGNIDCRYHLLPFISPYALVVFAFHIVVGDMDRLTFFGHRVFKKDNIKTKILSNIIIFLLFCCLVFFGELAVGNLWDKCFGVQLWNYLDYPLHLTRYASVVTALEFGGACYILFRFVYTPALKAVRKHMNFKVARIICFTLGIAIVLDTCWMMLYIMIFHSSPMYWSIRVR